MLRFLKARPRSEHEVRQRLTSHKFTEDEIGSAIRQAVGAGLIDDEAFARLWIEDRILHSPRSRRAVERELLEKGVDRALVAKSIADRYPESKERELLWRLASERLERLANLEKESRERRTFGYLARRGFPLGQTKGIIRQLVSEMETPSPGTGEDRGTSDV